MDYFKVTNNFIRELRNAWHSFINSVLSKINNVARCAIADVESEALDDLRNGRYEEQSVLNWKRDQINDVEEWKTDCFLSCEEHKRECDRLIDILSNMKFFENQKNKRFIFDFYKCSYYDEYDEDLDGAICVRIEDVTREGSYGRYSYEIEFDSPEVEYTDWMSDD